MFKQLLIAVLLTGTASAANPTDFSLANQRYDEGKFAEAQELYGTLVQSGNYSANLFHNLGNTAVRRGDAGVAMLNYERALALEPSHPEARANLAFVRKETGAKIEPRTWVDGMFLPLGANVYAIAAAVSAWLVLGCLALLAWKRPRERALLWFTCIIAFAACVYAGAALVRSAKENALAIIVAPKAEARFAPADNATLADTLPTGSHVRILSERGPWVYCELPNKTRAWLATKAVKRVRLGV